MLTTWRVREAGVGVTANILDPDQRVFRRPFTAPELNAQDLVILHSMLDDLRALLARWQEGKKELTPYQRIGWRVGGLRRRVVVCDPDRLLADTDLCIVGFLARRNPELDMSALERANTAIVRDFKDYPGILSYSSCELPGSNWANLVLNDDPEAPERWRGGAAHARAANELSPKYYRNVRIHNGDLAGGVHSGKPITIQRTKYYDYKAQTVWRAVRDVSGAPAT